MERLTREVVGGLYCLTDSVNSNENTLYAGIKKLGQLEDILEKYGLFNLEELDHRLDENLKQFTQMGYGDRTWEEYYNIEKELGIDLITLVKALKNGVYVKDKNKVYYTGSPYLCFAENNKRELEMQFRVIDAWYYIKDYGKTWALTKEELEK